MKQYVKIIVAALAVCSLTSQAQTFSSSYFMETNNFRHQLNPALLDQSYFSIPFLGNTSVSATGNVGYSTFVYDYYEHGQKKQTSFMSPNVDAHRFLSNLSSSNNVEFNLKEEIFSIAFGAFGGTNLVDLGFRTNFSVTAPYSLFEFMKVGINDKNSTGFLIRDLAFRTNTYAELGIAHSHQIGERVKIGAKAKFLIGLAYADLQIKYLDLKYNLNDYNWSIKGFGQIKAGGALRQLSYDYDKLSPTGAPRVDGLEVETISVDGNYGVAFDLGAKVQVIDGLTVSASLTDLGFLSYTGMQQATTRGEYSFGGFQEFEDAIADGELDDVKGQLTAIGNDLSTMFSLYADGETDQSQSLTAKFNLAAEYTMPFYDRLRFGVLYTHNFNSIYDYNQAMFSLAVHPANCFEFALTTTASSNGASGGFALGLNLARFCFHMGADRICFDVSDDYIPNNAMNIDFNMGFSIKL